jgi:hypothetical protein
MNILNVSGVFMFVRFVCCEGREGGGRREMDSGKHLLTIKLVE